MIKPWTSISEQIRILEERGLQDAGRYEKELRQIGYYRLSGYAYSLRQSSTSTDNKKIIGDAYIPGAQMHHVLDLYRFDENLRLAVWQAVRELEISFRVMMGHELGRVDPLMHTHVQDLWPRGQKNARAREFINRLESAVNRSKEDFVQHHRVVYGGVMPIWVVTELLEFGQLVTLFSLAPFEQRVAIARNVDCRADEFESWLRTMNVLRNITAHHARLWNRVISPKPMTRYRNRDSIFGDSLSDSGKPFAALTIVVYLLGKLGLRELQSKLVSVLAGFPSHVPGVSFLTMGIKSDWREVPVWNECIC